LPNSLRQPNYEQSTLLREDQPLLTCTTLTLFSQLLVL
jgi:hypothetical protein